MFSRTALSLRCVCVRAGRRRAFDACFFAVLHGSGGAVDKSVFSRVFAMAPYVFLFFFAVFAYQNRQNPPACVAAIYRVILITDLLSSPVLTLLEQWITSIQWQSRKKAIGAGIVFSRHRAVSHLFQMSGPESVLKRFPFLPLGQVGLILTELY